MRQSDPRQLRLRAGGSAAPWSTVRDRQGQRNDCRRGGARRRPTISAARLFERPGRELVEWHEEIAVGSQALEGPREVGHDRHTLGAVGGDDA